MGGVGCEDLCGQVEPDEDLAIGRLDAVLLDLPKLPIMRNRTESQICRSPVGEGFYELRSGREKLGVEGEDR